ncbi:ABC transporter ATP-binding protein [Nocardioides terrigena]|uniref:ABC transporter ATP-binding protein n=1 Tax=Nocardioides terrigena TaxID=424797 RepID=UPI000D3264AC|nr:ATP-binding cassette domain-containing protein [Nocardioides terrigena]
MTAMVELRAASKAYQGVPAVQAVDLEVQRGERLAIIGPNGAGKSTLFGMIAGEHRPTEGSVWFNGKDVTTHHSSRRARAGISRTFQVARLMPTMTVRENLFLAALTGQRQGIRFWDALSTRPDVTEEAEAAMVAAGLADLSDVLASSLAQGARKTLEMAMAVVQKPTLLLLDEPTAGMGYDDARIATKQLGALLEERREMTIILTAHDMEVIHSLAERVVLMANGKVVLDGSPQYVADHAVTKELYLGRGAS